MTTPAKTMKYRTYYTASSGQPTNGEEVHEDFAAALGAWRSNINALPVRSGGRSTLEERPFTSEAGECQNSLTWLEHVEGGYPYASGWLGTELDSIAQQRDEDGETLTADDVMEALSSR